MNLSRGVCEKAVSSIVEISIVEISVKVSALLAAWPGLKTRIEFDLNYNKL